jgi:DNA-directed RNA polymerase subunit alpha
MQTVALPQKIEHQKGTKPNQSQITIEPCYPGYGITLGNSLRRVLLSSLLGAAPVGVKIKGVDHEFTTIPHFREDVLELIMNIKQLKLKIFSDEVVKLELDVHGEKEVKASDIKKNSLVEIANPDLVLGHITDMSGSLQAEIFVSQGMGYETIENREKEEREIGYIEMDSIFSPVMSAGIKVESVRVGKMTNWDRLILDITTDGTISPKVAFEQAVKILIEQYNALLPDSQKAKEEDNPLEKDKKEEDKKIDTEIQEEPEEKEGGDQENSEQDRQESNLPAQAGKARKPTPGRDRQESKEETAGEEVEEEKPKKKRGRPKKVD